MIQCAPRRADVQINEAIRAAIPHFTPRALEHPTCDSTHAGEFKYDRYEM
jgi:hypothetical protein